MAALTLDEFRAEFPEFRQVDDDIVERALARAESEMDPDVWGTVFPNGHGALTAHKLSLAYQDPQDPHLGQYLKEYKRLIKQVASGYRVA